MTDPKKIKELFDILLTSEFFNFPVIGKVDASESHGVYLISSPTNEILHVGKTDRGKLGLNQRIKNHLDNLSLFSIHYLKRECKVLRDGYKFKFLVVSDAKERAYLEALATCLLCPQHIGTGEK